ncbi:MAG: YrzI family small protein [Dehalococcoidales bacterium]|nr:MAG: YrzI family small protein [Dehalococcoidales bacterium]
MLVKIKCPKCESEGSMSLVDDYYQGPYKCWKCRELFTITIDKNELKSCEPLSQEELERQQEIDALRNQFRRQ